MNSAETLANLQKFLTLLNPSLNLTEMLTNVARQLVEMFQVDHSGMLRFGEEDVEGEVIAEYPNQGALGLKVPLTGYPLVERLKTDKKPIAVLDAQHDPMMGQARATMRLLGIQSIVIIPLVVQNKIVGSLSLDATGQPRVFTEGELNLCHVIGNQIAVALDYIRALEIAEANRRQAQTLGDINHILSKSLDLDEILPLILEQLEKVLPVDGSSIWLLAEGGIQLKVYRGEYNPFSEQQIIPLDTLWGAAEIIKTKEPELISNTEQAAQWSVYPNSPVKSWLGVPLVVRGEVVGILNMDGYSPGQFSQFHLKLAQAFADQAAIAIHNARLYGQATQRADLLASVQEIGLSLVSSLDLQNVLTAIATSVMTLLQADEVRIYLYNPGTASFTLAAVPDKTGQLSMKLGQPRPDGLTAAVAHTGRYLAIPNTTEHPLYQDEREQDFKAIIGVPLKKRDEVLGVLDVFYEMPHHFTVDELYLLDLLATQAAVALENARLYQLEVKQVEQELEIARQIQRGFFPQRIPQLSGWEIAAACLPARETGGDFYEFVERTDGLLGLIVGDVSGKSISAAMLMAAAQSLVNAKASDYHSPARVMAEANRLLCKDVPHGAFVALAYALLRPDDSQVCLSNGGQLDPFLVPADNRPIRLIETPGNRLPLGIVRNLTYQETFLTVTPGDLLIFYTDGVVERKDAAGRLFGFDRVAAALESVRGRPPEVALGILLKAADAFANGVTAHDDVTLVIAQRIAR